MNARKLLTTHIGPVITTATLLLVTMIGTASAKDAVNVTVSPSQQHDAVVVNNGQANGTIQLFYTVNAAQFPIGFFATFDINWVVAQGRQATNYGSTGVPFNLTQDQEGGYVDLWPVPASFTLTHAGQSGTSTVSVSIKTDKSGKVPSADGTDLVGNLKLDATSSVSSVTNIQVHIRLVHPTNCLRVYDFVTDQGFDLGILDGTEVKVGASGAKKGLVISSSPGQFSANVLIANACASDFSFDLGVGLDKSFSINSNGNPVAAYTAAGDFDTDNFGDLLVGPKTNYGQALCLPNVTVPAGSSLLVTAHAEVTKNTAASTLPADGTFDFAAALFQNVNTGCTGTPLPETPNPVPFTLPYTVKTN